MKQCAKCGDEKPREQFHRKASSTDGLQSACKACRLAHAGDYYARNADRINARARDSYAANAEQRRAEKARYREANRGRSAVYRAANPHLWWESNYRDRAIRYGFEPSVESFTRAELIARYGDACAHCGGPFTELDHFPVPVALGGPHNLDNCVPACLPCNRVQAGPIRVARTQQKAISL